MSQHDLDIANQGFPATRADLNLALKALGSSNSGASAPSTTYANQLWYDTANNIIKIRNEDNDAWISLFTLDQSADAVTQIDVDNIRIDGNTISSTNTNGDITLDPNGTGDVAVASGQINFGAVSNGVESIHLRKSGNSVAGLGVNTQYGVRVAGPSDSSAPVSIGNISASDGTTFTESLRVDGSGNVVIADGKIEADNASNPALSGVTNRNTILQLQNTDTGYVAGNATAIDFGTSLTSATASIIGRNHNAGSGYGGDLILATSPTSGDSLTERLRVDSSGNVGIGTASPSKPLHVSLPTGSGATPRATAVAVIDGNDNTQLDILGGTGSILGINFGDSSDNDQARITCNTTSGSENMAFTVNAAERMRLLSNGQILIGCTSSPSSSVAGFQISPDLSSEWSRSGTSVAGATRHIGFYNTHGLVGDIITNQNSTSFQSLSDYRVKENVVDLTGAIDRVKALEPKRFNFISNADITVDGFLAHEAQTVVPESVNGTKDGMRDEEYIVSAATGDIYTPAAPATYDEDGEELTAATNEVIHSSDAEKPEELADGQQWRETTAAVMGTRSVPDYQGIDQAKLVPLLTAALKESIAKIESLETRVAALEA